MHGPYHFFAKYGVATDFYFCAQDPADEDRFINIAVPWIAGDAQVDKDGGGPANVSALPTRVGTSALYKWAATGTELEARIINFLLIDADGPAWSDLHMTIETQLFLGKVDFDATAIGGNEHALSLIGVGTGYGLFAKGAWGIRGEAQGTSGHGIGGVGVGPGHGIAGVAGSGGKVCNFWDSQEGPEPLIGPPLDDATYGQIQQYLKRRHTNKVTQDSGAQIWYRDDSVVVLTSRTVSDDLITQVQNKLT
jgi:hypothetical protein